MVSCAPKDVQLHHVLGFTAARMTDHHIVNRYSISIHFNSANGLLCSNYVCMKVTSIKICSNEAVNERFIN